MKFETFVMRLGCVIC